MAPAGPVRAFLSYAHEDHAWRDALLGHLGWLIESGQLTVFRDPQIEPGREWNGVIRAELTAAEIVFVLASRHFFASPFCIRGELMPALARREQGCVLVPILCRPLDLGATPLGDLQCLPQDPKTSDLKALEQWGDEVEAAFAIVTAKVRGIMDRLRPAAPVPEVTDRPSTPLATGLPPRGRFVGRATDLDQLRAWILHEERRPIIVLGPGGIGKSKLTIAALHDPAVAARFVDRRYFVRLDEVRDEAGVYGAVAAALGREPGAQPLADVIAALAAEQALLVLDNAESPWEVDPTGVEQAFARLAELPGTSLVVSLRGFELPGIADWRPILIEPLPLDPARSLFLAIAGDRYAADPALPKLLARLDGLPLAIELVAHRARTEPDAATVLRQWESERSAFVRRGQGGRKDLDLAASIALSLASPRLSNAGRRLFAVLGRLPHGLARADLPAIMPRDGNAAANALAQTGLVLPDPDRLRMLAPVREHAAEHTPSDAEATALAAHNSALADMLRYLDESSYDRDAALRARVELPNIEAVLPRRTTNPASWALGWRWIRVGDTRRTLGSLGPALAAYEIARDCFAARATVKAADPGNARWQSDLSSSWERLGDVRTTQGDLPGALQAYAEAKNIADKLAAADSRNAQLQRRLFSVLWRVGYVKQLQGNIADALISLQAGHRIIAKLAAADPRNARWQSDLSSSWYKLGDVLRAQGDLEGALQAYTEDMKISAKLAATDPGNAEWQHGVAVSWERLGILAESQSPSEKKVSGISGLLRPCSARNEGSRPMWTASARHQYRRTGGRYATDVTDAEFALIEPLLPCAKRGGRRRTTVLREVLNALLYLLRTGCPWRMLPREFPPRSTVYGYFRRFWQEGIWSTIQTTLLMAARERAGREASPTAGMIDSQSVKTTEAGGPRGFDAGKKVNGRKRHLLTDTLGLPLWLVVHAANVQDRDGLGLVCARIRQRFPWLRHLFADAGYQGEIAMGAAARERLRLEIVKRPREADGFHLLPRRWVIERTFAWLGRNRRLAKDFERLIDTTTAMAYLAIIQLLMRRLASS